MHCQGPFPEHARAAPNRLAAMARTRKENGIPVYPAHVLFWAVVSDSLQEALELFPTRAEAEAVVRAWDREEPDQQGLLHVGDRR
jgi:hypothetical protein